MATRTGKTMSAKEKKSRLVPASAHGDLKLREAGLKKATSKVRARATIDFVRSIRRK